MESKRAPVSSPEFAASTPDTALKHVDADSKTSKSKKTSLPSDAILNAQLFDEAKDAPAAHAKSEKNGWDIEALFGNQEQKASTEEIPEASETLNDNETREVVQNYIDDRTEAIDTELADVEEESPLAEIVSANQVLLDKLREQVATSEKPVDDILEEATQSTIQELQLEQPDTPDGSRTTPQSAPQEPLRTTVRRKEAAIASILSEEAPALPDEDRSPSSVTPPLPPAPPSEVSTSESSGGPEPEPQRQHTLEEAAMPLSDDLAREVHAAHSTHETQTPATSVSATERPKEAGFTRGDVAKGVLVGGVAGYMVGRHTGRKRAEAKARPVHAEMSKEIASLQHKIAENEQVIRSLAAKKTAYTQAEKTQPQPAYGTEKLNAQWTKPSKPVETLPLSAVSTERPTKSHAEVFAPSAAPSVAEKAANTTLSNNQETPTREPSRPPSQEQVRAVRPIEKLPIEDVLVLAKNVKVEGEPLDSYYRRGQLTETDVRKILVEHRRTGRPERAFYKHIAMHERHRDHSSVESRQRSRNIRHNKPETSMQGNVHVQQSISDTLSGSFADGVREAHPKPIDKIHADNTPRLSMTLTLGIIVLVILAFFIVRIILG